MRGALKKKKVSFHSAHFRKEPFLVFFFHVSGKCFLLQNFLFAMLSAFLSPSYFLFFFFCFSTPPKKKERRD